MSLLLATLLATNLTLTPFTDLGNREYAYGYFGGLWENGSSTIPADHLAAGLARAATIRPLDADGNPSPDGKIVFLSAGSTEAQQIFGAFSALAANDAHVRQNGLVFANTAASGFDALRWVAPNDRNYDRVDSQLASLGVTPAQVQVAWLDLSTDFPAAPLPIQDADAYRLKGSIAAALRSLQERYPNLKVAYLSSRVFGGWSQSPRNPEPYAYESVLSVRWIVVGQVLTMRTAAIGPYWDTRIGDINYEHGIAPWATWGPYLWADGTTPRSDGLTWPRDDFEADGETLSAKGAQKAGALMLRFFLREPTAAGWFATSQPPARNRAAHH
jgi:hypothetical protein